MSSSKLPLTPNKTSFPSVTTPCRVNTKVEFRGSFTNTQSKHRAQSCPWP